MRRKLKKEEIHDFVKSYYGSGRVTEFLESILGSDCGGFVEIRMVREKRVRCMFYRNVEQAAKDLFINKIHLLTAWNVYFGICPRNKEQGKEENVEFVNCLWADLDCYDKKEMQDGPEMVENRKARMSDLKGLKLPPSFIVNSGRGLHCYWLLEEPYAIKNEQDFLNIKGYLKGLSHVLGGDSTFDLARCFRVPGTVNLKNKNQPLPVEIIEFNSQLRYKVSQFDEFKEELDVSSVSVDTSIDDIPDRFWRILEENEKLKRTWQGRRKDLKDSSRSGYDMSLANLLMPYNFSDGEIAAILRASPSGKGREAKRQYLGLTIGKARAEWEKKKPLKINEVLNSFKKWLELEETDYIEVILATVASNEIPGDPVWLFVIGPPGASKTEVLRSFKYLKDRVFITSKLTPQSLISGKQTKDFDPSLLPKLDKRTLIIKDFTSILSMRSDSREIILSDLREAYDGYLDKDFGNIGHRGYSSHFSVLAGVTPVLDKYTSVQQSLGERFLRIRLKEPNRESVVSRAIGNEFQQEEMREEVAQVIKRFYEQKFSVKGITRSKEIKEKLVHLANFIAICRTTVSRDPYRKNVLTYLPEYEIGTRLGIQLAKLGTGLAAIREKETMGEDEFQILKRVGLDTVPKKVRVLLEHLNHQSELTTSEIVEKTGIEGETCRLALNDLAVLKLVERHKIKGIGNPLAWNLTPKSQELLDKSDLYF